MDALSMRAHREWASRPADQRYETLAALRDAVHNRRMRSLAFDVTPEDLVVTPTHEPGDGEGLIVRARKINEDATPTHWSFGQMSSLVGAPAGFLRDLPAKLTADVLNDRLQAKRFDKGVKLMVIDEPNAPQGTLACVTSQTYGRIWDADVVDATERIVLAHPAFFNPKDWSGKPSGLYASDRDVFLFFVNGGSIVDGGGDRDQLSRGFFVWNSEVGAATMGICSFLFRVVCGNHIIWDMQQARLLKIRHTSGGPERFVSEAIPALQAYVESSAGPTEQVIRKAKAYELPSKEKEWEEFFLSRSFSKAEIKRAKNFADTEEGGSHTLWLMVQGFTRAARDLAFVDARVDLETRAGKLMKLAEAA